MAEYRVIGGVDADADAIASYAASFGTSAGLCEDLLQITAAQVLRRAGISRGDVDVLVGGPPCQPYSVNNHQRGTTDSRCLLVMRFMEFASALKPRWVMMENVPGLLSLEDGVFFETILQSLRSRGYKASFQVLDSARLGVPQRRQRLVLLGSRETTDPATVMKSLRA